MNAEPRLSLRQEHDEPDSRPVPLGPAPVVARDDERPLPRAQRVTPSAADITSERMLRAQAEPPPSGWRRALFQMTRGLVNPGPSAADRDRRELVARVKSPVAGCRRIAVVSRKGGVGKTTTTLMLGHTFASLRGDRVIALDGNPDAGSLAYRVRRETSNTITGLLAHRNAINRYADIRAYTYQAPTRLEVVAADDDPRITDALVEQDFYMTSPRLSDRAARQSAPRMSVQTAIAGAGAANSSDTQQPQVPETFCCAVVSSLTILCTLRSPPAADRGSGCA
jgi:putative peptide zinc metalloprotease protein